MAKLPMGRQMPPQGAVWGIRHARGLQPQRRDPPFIRTFLRNRNGRLLCSRLGLASAPHPPAAVRWWALGIGVVFLTLAFLWTAPLAPLNRLWSKLGLLLFHIVSPVVLGLLFYLTVTPVGFLLRLFGKDPLRLRRDSAAKSYWILREPPGPAPKSMKHQF